MQDARATVGMFYPALMGSCTNQRSCTPTSPLTTGCTHQLVPMIVPHTQQPALQQHMLMPSSADGGELPYLPAPAHALVSAGAPPHTGRAGIPPPACQCQAQTAPAASLAARPLQRAAVVTRRSSAGGIPGRIMLAGWQWHLILG
jgi:hypothetical protein